MKSVKLQRFCDKFCLGDRGIHICLSKEDFEGFDLWNTSTSMESCDAVYRCLKCESCDDDFDRIKEHNLSDHKDNITSNCNFCTYKTIPGKCAHLDCLVLFSVLYTQTSRKLKPFHKQIFTSKFPPIGKIKAL